jgi:hypothetical protein
VPAPLAAVLARGLALDPSARFPDVRSLLDALARTSPAALRRMRQRRLGGLGLAGLLGGALLLLGLRLGFFGPRVPGCGDGILYPGEECDDASATRTSACLRCTDGDARLAWPEKGACYERHEAPLPFAEAARLCHARDGLLVSFGGAGEAAALLRQTDGDATWIGLQRAPDQGFAWLGGEPWADPLPRFWGGAEKPAGKDCVVLVYSGQRTDIPIPARWRAVDCDERHAADHLPQRPILSPPSTRTSFRNRQRAGIGPCTAPLQSVWAIPAARRVLHASIRNPSSISRHRAPTHRGATHAPPLHVTQCPHTLCE